MHDRSVALVTGANQGIDFQIAKDLTAGGFIVLRGSSASKTALNALTGFADATLGAFPW